MRPGKSYFICFTLRSGSTLLSQLLADTGIAGQPKEHFYHNIAPENPHGDVIPDYRAYLEHVLAADTSANGVFGSKVGGGYWRDFTRRLRSIAGMDHLPLDSRPGPLLPRPALPAPDAPQQSPASRLPLAGDPERPLDFAGRRTTIEAPRYDFAAIDHLLQEIIMREAVWAEYFSENGIQPLGHHL